jgi:hypothetical protein
LCPKHADILPWVDNNCNGCVSGWWDNSCPLKDSFAFIRKNHPATITEEQLEIIDSGKCPFRVNGCFSFSREEGFLEINTSSPERESGGKLAGYIREYIKQGEEE